MSEQAAGPSVGGNSDTARQAPPLAEFVTGLAALPEAKRVPALWEDQRRRWQRGERARVEAYLEALSPSARGDVIVDLVYGEFVLREEGREGPRAEEYVARFPDHAPEIRRQLGIHQRLSGDSSPSSGATLTWERPTEEATVPSEIAGYRIVAALQAGGQGAVYRGVHPTLQRDVVIKVGHAAVEGSGRALVAEGRILAELDHPGLARVYDLRLHEGRPCLVMEYVRGADLEQQARRRTFSPTEAASLVARVARALAEAHRRGVVHRDLKPRNILLDDAGNPRVIDFGLALVEDAWRRPEEQAGAVSGTVSYMAPEQARGAGTTARSDIFGLGGVLYFLLTGRAPYTGDGFYDLLMRAATGEWDRAALDGRPVPPRVRAVVERALAPDPAARFASAEEMAAALESAARPARRWPWLAAAGTAALLVIAGLAVWAAKRSAPATTSAGTDPTQPADRGAVAGVPRKFELMVKVKRGGRTGFGDLVDRAPVETGDELRVETVAPAKMYATLFYLTSERQLKQLAEAAPADQDRPLEWPQDPREWAPVEGPRGNELVLMAARRSRPVTADDLRESLAGAWAELPPEAVIRLDPDRVKALVASRGPGAPRAHDDPEGEARYRLEKLRKQFREQFDHFEGLMFLYKP
jgi:hypothetical protein